MSFESHSNCNQKKDVEKSKNQSKVIEDLKLFLTPFNIATIALILIGILFLIIVVDVIWNDSIFYQKDITSIFFENRSTQIISLGLGLQLIHDHLLSIIFIATGSSMYILRKK